MNRYRFVITANGFELAVRFAEKEERGLEWGKRYMSQFQRQVANVQLKVAIYFKDIPPGTKMWEREKVKKLPYLHQRNLIKKPLEKRGQ